MKPVIEMVDRAMVPILRRKTEAERLAIAWGMWRSARDVLRNMLRAEDRERSDAEIVREIARRLSHGAHGAAPSCLHGLGPADQQVERRIAVDILGQSDMGTVGP
jgi:hypothetical protein